MNSSEMYNSISFDKCKQMCHYHLNQSGGHFYYPRKLCVPHSSQLHNLGNHYSHFHHQRLTSSVLELHLNRIITCVLFLLYYLTQNKFLDSSVLLISVVYSFHC